RRDREPLHPALRPGPGRHQRARQAALGGRAGPDHALLRHLLQRLPRELLAPLDAGARRAAHRPHLGDRAPGGDALHRARLPAAPGVPEHLGHGRAGLRPPADRLRRRRLVLVRRLRRRRGPHRPQRRMDRRRGPRPHGGQLLDLDDHDEQGRVLPREHPHHRRGPGPARAAGRHVRRRPGQGPADRPSPGARAAAAAARGAAADPRTGQHRRLRGFSRGMYEAATAGASTYVINCDDDIVIEPESLIRMTTFADFATRPTLVGAHMFDLNNRSVLHTYGEVVDPWRIQPAVAIAEGTTGHDFAAEPLRSTPWLHRRADVDYNGWWSCLIPTETVRAIGLSLPVFIKWDDAEYGLRAKKAGYPTVSLPGAGVWHMSWVDKDDLVGWQAYFHERNRIITALLHSPYSRGGRVVRESQFM